MVTDEYKRALVEVLEIVNYLDDEDKKKIPDEIIKFYEDNKSTEYKFSLDPTKEITKQKLMSKTREILAGIYVDFLCTNKDEKKAYLSKLKQLEFNYESQKRKKYNPDVLFNRFRNNSYDNIVENNEEKALVPVKKDNFFIRLLKKIKSLLSRKN